MISIHPKRQIIFYLCYILSLVLSFMLLSPIVIQTGRFLGTFDIFGPDLTKTEDLYGIESGMANASEVTHRILWHSKGQPDDKMNRPQGCCLDPDSSLIYVADTDNDRVILFARDGEYIGPFLTSRPVKRPFDLIVGPDSLIYISQVDGKWIEVFNKKGIWQTSIPDIPRRKEWEFKPGRMVFDRKGRLLVNDRGSGAIWFMTKEGKVLKKQYVAKNGKASRLLSGIALDTRGRIYVISAQGSPVITILDAEGARIHSFGRHGALHEDSLSFPHSLAVDSKDRIWLVDAFRHTIKVFGPDWRHLFNIGEFGEKSGGFVYPVDIEIDKEGKLYVLEKGAGRLQALSVIFEWTEGLE
jgi:sugar lactone lactonase YvrE